MGCVPIFSIFSFLEEVESLRETSVLLPLFLKLLNLLWGLVPLEFKEKIQELLRRELPQV